MSAEDNLVPQNSFESNNAWRRGGAW